MAYIESVIIKDSGGTEADVTAANALKVDGSAVTQPVNVVGGSLSATLAIQTDMFQQTLVESRYNQIEIKYDQTDPDAISDLTVTKTTTGDASNVAGQALFTTGANTNGGVKAVTTAIVTYRPHAEVYAAFTAIWTSGGLANSYQRIGIYDASNGFFIGYEGTVFGITIRKAAADTQIAQASWNVDTLTGAVGSKYTRAGVPEAANFALDNLFRIRYGWLGAAPIVWEIFSPDGAWVVFHIQRYPNTVAVPSLTNPDLPMTLEVKKNTGGATVLNMNTACWAAGTSSDLSKITDTITDNTLAPTTRSVITGRSSTGGGTYYNVKVNPSGALVTTNDSAYAEDSAAASGDIGNFVLGVRNDANSVVTSNDGDYSQISVNDKGAIAIQDGGNSITVDGTVGISGTVSVDIVTDSVGLATESTLVNVDKGIQAMQHLEDSASNDGDIGIFALAVRNDTNAVVTSNDGDYSQISVNDKGAVAIQDGGNSITVDGTVGVSGTVTVSGTVAATQSGTWVLGANSGVDIGDVTINNAAGASAVNIQDGGNSITVDGTVAFSNTTIAVTNTGTFAVQAAQSGTWVLGANSGVDIGDVTINNAAGASAVNIQDGGNSITVDGTVAFSNTSIAVTNAGTFAVQAAQSGSWSVTNLANSGVDIGDVTINNASGASAVNIQDGGNSITVDGTVAATQSGTWILGANPGVDIGDVTINNASGASAVNIQDGGNSITVDGTVTVTPPTLTKGTQGATGFSTQDLKDAGRTAVRYYATAAAAGTTTTETAITLTKSSGTSATTTGTSFVITSGKTFRIQAVSFATRGNATATIQSTTFNFRINTGGAVTTTSTPIILSMRSATPATASAWDRILLEMPDGMEIAGDGTLQFGITAAATYTTNAPTWDVTIIGFEY